VKLSPRIAEVVRKMSPGLLVRDGMLGSDRRPLPEILDADNAVVIGLDLTHEGIGGRMDELSQAGRRGLGDVVTFEDRYEVQVHEVQGGMRCPFGDSGIFRKVVTTAKSLATGECVRWSELGAHMIRSHGFYQGRGSKWRLRPEDLARFLNIRARP